MLHILAVSRRRQHTRRGFSAFRYAWEHPSIILTGSPHTSWPIVETAVFERLQWVDIEQSKVFFEGCCRDCHHPPQQRRAW